MDHRHRYGYFPDRFSARRGGWISCCSSTAWNRPTALATASAKRIWWPSSKAISSCDHTRIRSISPTASFNPFKWVGIASLVADGLQINQIEKKPNYVFAIKENQRTGTICQMFDLICSLVRVQRVATSRFKLLLLATAKTTSLRWLPFQKSLWSRSCVYRELFG